MQLILDLILFLILLSSTVGISSLALMATSGFQAIRYRVTHKTWPLSVEEEKYLNKIRATEREKEAAISGLVQKNLLLTNENEMLRKKLEAADEQIKQMTKQVLSRITAK